jgi:hypothetical protein
MDSEAKRSGPHRDISGIETELFSATLVTPLELEALPRLEGQEAKGLDATAHVKLYSPGSRMRYYLTECDGHDVAYGWWLLPEQFHQQGHEDRWHYVGLGRLSQMASEAMALGEPVLLRDWAWRPMTVREVIEHTQRHGWGP